MLAQGIKLDVFDQDDLARFRIENRMVDNLIDVLPITLGQEFERARSSRRSSGQPLSLRIFANRLEQIAISVFEQLELAIVDLGTGRQKIFSQYWSSYYFVFYLHVFAP